MQIYIYLINIQIFIIKYEMNSLEIRGKKEFLWVKCENSPLYRNFF